MDYETWMCLGIVVISYIARLAVSSFSRETLLDFPELSKRAQNVTLDKRTHP